MRGVGVVALSDVNLFAPFTAQTGGHAHLCTEGGADRLPAVVNAVGLQTQPDLVHQIVGQHADEQVPFDPVGLLVEDRAHPQLGFETVKDRLQIGQQGVGMPQSRFIPFGLVRAQTVDTGMGVRVFRALDAPVV